MELKKPHLPRLVGGAQTWNRLVPHPRTVDKIQQAYLGVRSPSPTPGPPTQGSSTRKINPHNFWLQKQVVIESVEEISGAVSSSS